MVRCLAIGQVWAFLLFLTSLDPIASAKNRYFMHWSWPDPVLYIGLLAGVGLILSGLGLVVRWWRPALAHRLVLPAGLAVIGLYVRQALFFDKKSTTNLLLNALLVLAAIAIALELSRRFRWTSAKWRTVLIKVSLFFSPVVPILWVTALSFPRYEFPPPPSLDDARQVAAVAGSQPTENVYVFVFDAWSYRMTLDEGEVWPHLPHLHQAVQRMCVFTDAHSPGCHTVTSLPRLIYQRPDSFTLRGKRIGFWDGAFHDTQTLPSLFSRAREQGYRTYMIGFYHPYHAMLGSSVDFVRTMPETAHFGEGAWPRAQSFFAEWTARLLGPRLAYSTVGTRHAQRNERFVYWTRTVLDNVDAVLEDRRPAGQFAIFHIPLPHCPFCFGPEGLRPLSETYDVASPALVRDQLEYTDQVIGRLLERLEALGKGQNSTVIITSDHTWREDPLLSQTTAHDWTHVPLFIRFPGQQRPVRVEAPFSTIHLGRVLEAARQPGFSPEDLLPLIRSGDWFVPVADREIVQGFPQVR